MRCYAIVATGICAALLYGGSCAASQEKKHSLEFSAGVDLVSGEQNYQVNVLHPQFGSHGLEERQTEFIKIKLPVDMWMGSVRAGVGVMDNRIQIRAFLKKNVNDPDSRITYSVRNLWILEEIEQMPAGGYTSYADWNIRDYDAKMYGLGVDWLFFKRKWGGFFVGLGYERHEYHYDASLGNREYTGGGAGGAGEAGGFAGIDVNYFDMSYDVFYPRIGYRGGFGENLSFSAFLGVPGLAWGDYDDDVPENSFGELDVGDGLDDGGAFTFDVAVDYRFGRGYFLQGGLHYEAISVDGEAGRMSGLYAFEEELSDEQISGRLMFGKYF